MAKRPFMACTPIILPDSEQIEAARMAVEINPANKPAYQYVATELTIQALAGLTQALWPSGGARLPVYFMEQQPDDLKREILKHLNCWYDEARCNVQFVLTANRGDSIIRASTGPGGYYSHVGAFNLRIPKNQQTMNLERITMRTPERERRRVIGHEAGHAIGWMHEHQRKEAIAKLNAQAVIRWGRETQGWSEAMVRQQILTPLKPEEITATPLADLNSLMAYHFDGSLTLDGKPIPGGYDLTEMDKAFAASVYPRPDSPPPPPPPTKQRYIIEGDNITITKAA
jgi:serralysin